MEKALLESIQKTLAYFDSADYPLTREEVYSFLWTPPTPNSLVWGQAPAMGFAQFLEILKQVQDDRKVETKFSYYFLPGRAGTVEARRARLAETEKKLKIARRAAKKIRSAPFVKAVFVCNSVGMEQAKEESDIDFFIVAAPRRVWLARFFTNLILRLWGLRVYGQKHKNRVCLSFYADSEHLNLENLRVADDDIHFAYWIHQMIPIYDPGNYYANFLAANSWTKKYLPNALARFEVVSRLRLRDSRLGKIWKTIWEKMWAGTYGDLIEGQVKALQMARLMFSLKEKAAAGDKSVVISDGILKFHENDTRAKYREEWKLKITNYQ
ncbi:hypothetical protein EPN28_01970 [Patescibacteria group bacterium]|nr:MAG: hypothetical protein EPN28_01970 [Patescibacteria group bacterium]